MKAAPTAKRIILQQPRSSQTDLLFEWDLFESIPTLPCEVTEDRKKVRFRCGFCNTYHYHDTVPSAFPDKGHHVSQCVVTPNPYPNGYSLRTDLDKIYSDLFPNFTVARRQENIDRHFEKCDRLRLPFCVVQPSRNYACFEMDFITVDSYGMDATIGSAIREWREKYRNSHPMRRLNRKKLYDGVMGKNQERCVTTFLWLLVNDIYLAAKVLMPIINDASHWVRPGGSWR